VTDSMTLIMPYVTETAELLHRSLGPSLGIASGASPIFNPISQQQRRGCCHIGGSKILLPRGLGRPSSAHVLLPHSPVIWKGVIS
jgi:hypothetical protein